MSKINRWFLGFFLAMMWPSVLMLYAAEPSPGGPSSASSASTASDDEMSQEEVRDPFGMGKVLEAEPPPPPVEVAKEDVPQVKVDLEGIGLGSKGAYAIIGGDVFYKGDTKNGIKLVEVRRQEVDILVNGGERTVSLFPGQDLQKARDRAKEKGAIESASVAHPPQTSSSVSGREQASL